MGIKVTAGRRGPGSAGTSDSERGTKSSVRLRRGEARRLAPEKLEDGRDITKRRGTCLQNDNSLTDGLSKNQSLFYREPPARLGGAASSTFLGKAPRTPQTLPVSG